MPISPTLSNEHSILQTKHCHFSEVEHSDQTILNAEPVVVDMILCPALKTVELNLLVEHVSTYLSPIVVTSYS